MASEASNLWKIRAYKSGWEGGFLPEGDLLVVAPNASVATQKAIRWIKKNEYVGYKITKVSHEGQIDIF